jgi:diguanylate cyclase (GGDEF)-like protein
MQAERSVELSTGRAVDPINWLSNPLDWRPIDRITLLALLVMLVPVLCGSGLALVMIFAPEYVHFALAWPLLALYGLHFLLLTGFLLAANSRRQQVDDWPLYEAFVCASFMVTVFITGFLTGTHFGESLLFNFLGILIVSALGTIRRLIITFYFGCALLAVFALSDLMEWVIAAPMLAKPLVSPAGHLVKGMAGIHIVLAIVAVGIGRLAMGAIARWVDRENLYREMSSIDGLTRVSNRRSFLERGESELSRARRFADSPVACIMVDLDHFKKINDTYGHHAGDQVLVVASGILMKSRRQYDEVGRYGGEEFALLLPNTTAATAALVAERIRSTIAGTPVDVDGHRILMTASFGVAAYPSTEVNCLNDLLKAADKALYEAKETGRNKVCVADAGSASPGRPS